MARLFMVVARLWAGLWCPRGPVALWLLAWCLRPFSFADSFALVVGLTAWPLCGCLRPFSFAESFARVAAVTLWPRRECRATR